MDIRRVSLRYSRGSNLFHGNHCSRQRFNPTKKRLADPKGIGQPRTQLTLVKETNRTCQPDIIVARQLIQILQRKFLVLLIFNRDLQTK